MLQRWPSLERSLCRCGHEQQESLVAPCHLFVQVSIKVNKACSEVKRLRIERPLGNEILLGSCTASNRDEVFEIFQNGVMQL